MSQETILVVNYWLFRAICSALDQFHFQFFCGPRFNRELAARSFLCAISATISSISRLSISTQERLIDLLLQVFRFGRLLSSA